MSSEFQPHAPIPFLESTFENRPIIARWGPQGFGEEAARTLIVDTSSLDAYEQARAFYTRRGFVQEARIRDFYGPGDDKVTFWKQITP